MKSRRKWYQVQRLSMLALFRLGALTKILDRVLRSSSLDLTSLEPLPLLWKVFRWLRRLSWEGFFQERSSKICSSEFQSLPLGLLSFFGCLLSFILLLRFPFSVLRPLLLTFFFLSWAYCFFHAHYFCSFLCNFPDFEKIITHSGPFDR